jgi:hypothetical protein
MMWFRVFRRAQRKAERGAERRLHGAVGRSVELASPRLRGDLFVHLVAIAHAAIAADAAMAIEPGRD